MLLEDEKTTTTCCIQGESTPGVFFYLKNPTKQKPPNNTETKTKHTHPTQNSAVAFSGLFFIPFLTSSIWFVFLLSLT